MIINMQSCSTIILAFFLPNIVLTHSLNPRTFYLFLFATNTVEDFNVNNIGYSFNTSNCNICNITGSKLTLYYHMRRRPLASPHCFRRDKKGNLTLRIAWLTWKMLFWLKKGIIYTVQRVRVSRRHEIKQDLYPTSCNERVG